MAAREAAARAGRCASKRSCSACTGQASSA
nr:MAG TPA: hypothetical protein [Caudoviricetes sp.]